MKPKEILTRRLTLAALRQEDRDDFIALMTDPEVGKTYIVPDLTTEEKKNALFERVRALSCPGERFVYGIFLDGRMIGLINEVAVNGDEIELGYVISPLQKNHGYASESLSACIPALFGIGYTKVKAGAFSENNASIRVMEKCGMKRTEESEEIAYRGSVHSCVYYEIKNKNA